MTHRLLSGQPGGRGAAVPREGTAKEKEVALGSEIMSSEIQGLGRVRNRVMGDCGSLCRLRNEATHAVRGTPAWHVVPARMLASRSRRQSQAAFMPGAASPGRVLSDAGGRYCSRSRAGLLTGAR